MLVNGRWTADWHPVQAKDEGGGFVRQSSQFKNWITRDGAPGPAGQGPGPAGQGPGPAGEGGFPAQAGRYHLYVALTCPWASRTLLARKIKKLDHVISVSIVEPFLTDQGWRFGNYPGADQDRLNGATWLHEIYTRADAAYTGRATVPVLWDKERQTIVNNESADILRMLNDAFASFAPDAIDLYPVARRGEIDALNEPIYHRLNNGVYRAGFATTQPAYEQAFQDVFGMLDELEARLDSHPFLVGDQLTDADIRLFVTLVRFDAAYHGLFKCNLRRIVDYPNLTHYLHRMLAFPGVAETVSIDHIKQGYYSIKALNPTGIVPLGPALSFAEQLGMS
jgi:glutathionyl-hydroquinone reductase